MSVYLTLNLLLSTAHEPNWVGAFCDSYKYIFVNLGKSILQFLQISIGPTFEHGTYDWQERD